MVLLQFSHKDRKYPTGSRTNRATANVGFLKATTGRDKCIRNTFKKIGMRKALVFYRGRAPLDQKTNWIMHEYRATEDDIDDEQAVDDSDDESVGDDDNKNEQFEDVDSEEEAEVDSDE